MRTKIVLSVVFFFMATFSLHAQTNFGFGLQKEIFGVSLNAENADDATFDVDKVELTMTMKDHFRIGLGVQMSTLVEHQAKRYDPDAGLSLSLTYLFPINSYKDYTIPKESFAIAPTLSVGNSSRISSRSKTLMSIWVSALICSKPCISELEQDTPNGIIQTSLMEITVSLGIGKWVLT